MASTLKSSTTTTYKVTRDQLPLSCPQTNDDVSSMHPRVFLDIKKTGEATCPYCGAKYQLQD